MEAGASCKNIDAVEKQASEAEIKTARSELTPEAGSPDASASLDQQTNEADTAKEKVHVNVMRLDGSSMDVDMDATQTVAELLREIVSRGGGASKRHRLLLDTEVLCETSTLKESGLHGNVTLTLVNVKSRYVGLAKHHHLGRIGTVAELFAERSFTVEAWVRVHEFNRSSQGDNAILGCVRYDTNRALTCQLRNGKPFMGFYYNDTAASKEAPLNVWTHLTFTYDYAAREQRIYMDGELLAARSPSEPLLGNYEVVVGEWAFGGRYLNGEIALLNVWSMALTPEQVQEAMKAGAPEREHTPEGMVRSLTFHDGEEGAYRLDAVSGQIMEFGDGYVIEVDDAPF